MYLSLLSHSLIGVKAEELSIKRDYEQMKKEGIQYGCPFLFNLLSFSALQYLNFFRSRGINKGCTNTSKTIRHHDTSKQLEALRSLYLLPKSTPSSNPPVYQ